MSLNQIKKCPRCKENKFISEFYTIKSGRQINRPSSFRGILCGNCNRGLGMFKDDPNLMIKATDYILKHCQ